MTENEYKRLNTTRQLSISDGILRQTVSVSNFKWFPRDLLENLNTDRIATDFRGISDKISVGKGLGNEYRLNEMGLTMSPLQTPARTVRT